MRTPDIGIDSDDYGRILLLVSPSIATLKTGAVLPRLLVFGYGYSARRIGSQLTERGWVVTGTTRTREGADAIAQTGVTPLIFDGTRPAAEVPGALRFSTHLLVTVPPGEQGDPVLAHHSSDVLDADALEWIGYLSTTSVYGDRDGAVVDEDMPPDPTSERGRRRLEAEEGWRDVARELDVPLQIFRLAGIYGPGRSVLDRLRQGTARRLARPGLVFNRIHVDDVAGAVIAGIDRPNETGVFNVSDDLPTPPAEVVEHGAGLLGVEPPPSMSMEEAELSPAARSFYEENKRVDNRRLKRVLEYRLVHPTYRSGLLAVVAEEDRA